MNRLRIGLTCEVFIEWGGGIDFLRLVLNGLVELKKSKPQISIVALIPKPTAMDELMSSLKNILKRGLNLFAKNKFAIAPTINYQRIIDDFRAVDQSITFRFYKRTKLTSVVVDEKINVLLPSFHPLPAAIKVPWIGYMFDFQHKYLPELFNPKDIAVREKSFPLMLEAAENVIVNSRAVKNDIHKYYDNILRAQITALPFCPVIDNAFFQTNIDLGHYKLPARYFLISNQFWKHKDHPTAFRALRILLNRNGDKNIGIVCTGQTFDFRFPHYYDELKSLIEELQLGEHVAILGYISKPEQLQLLKDCVAAVQPTLFEGGPGGGIIYESVAYGVRSIVSDIDVNRELDDSTVTFFKVGSAEDLADKMDTLLNQSYVRPSKEELEGNNQKRIQLMSAALDRAIGLATASGHSKTEADQV